MGQSKRPKNKASLISSAADPSASSATLTTSTSSISKSSFAPSHFQLCLFASVIQGVDSQHLRIHDTTTGRVHCEHVLASRASITCLDWGYWTREGLDRQSVGSNKKRKRKESSDGDNRSENGNDIALAFGTSDSEIFLFSTSKAEVLGVLRGGHTQGIRDFKFVEDGSLGRGWSAGGDGTLVQWDVKKGKPLRTVTPPTGPASAICPFGPSIICASTQASVLRPDSLQSPLKYNASTNKVHTIISAARRLSEGRLFLTSAAIDHYITVFDEESSMLIGTLSTDNEVLTLDDYSRLSGLSENERELGLETRMQYPQQALAAVNKAGVLEIFSEPFDFGSTAKNSSTNSLKARRQQKSRKASARITIKRPDKHRSRVPLINASFQGSHIALAWVEGGINPVFDVIPWRDEQSGKLLFEGDEDILKGKSGTGVAGAVMNGVKDMGTTHVDESHTVVTNGGGESVPMDVEKLQIIDISSGEEESDFEEDDESEPQIDEEQGKMNDVVSGEAHEDDDAVMEDASEEPSFGDLIRANAHEAIDVQASYADPNAQSLVPTTDRSLGQLPSGMSLGTVLTQSLRTNDMNLLETCFHVKDLQTVRATIERLDSSFAATLLQRLAERLHSRPGRAGSLMVWIQWTLVAHGGYLAGQPEIMKKLASLHRVVKDRASSLPLLLSLKGKLDMLEAQMNLRRSMQSRPANLDVEDDEEGVIYVEGQEESDFDSEQEDEEEDDHDSMDTAQATAVAKATAEDQAEGDSNTEMPTTVNGAVADSEDDDSESDGMIDDQASSTEQDSEDDLSNDSIDHDSVDTDSSKDDAPPPVAAKRATKNPKLSNGVGAKHG